MNISSWTGILVAGLAMTVMAETTVRVKAPQVLNAQAAKTQLAGAKTIVVEPGAQLDLAAVKDGEYSPAFGPTIHIAGAGPDGHGAPDLQVGEGCETDALAGERTDMARARRRRKFVQDLVRINLARALQSGGVLILCVTT